MNRQQMIIVIAVSGSVLVLATVTVIVIIVRLVLRKVYVKYIQRNSLLLYVLEYSYFHSVFVRVCLCAFICASRSGLSGS